MKYKPFHRIFLKLEKFSNNFYTGQFCPPACLPCRLPRPPAVSTCRDIGAKLHPDMDQLIRVEKGNAMVMTGNCPHNLNCEQRMCKGDAVFVPARTWHNIKNTGKCPLRLSTIYAPPHHPFGTVEYTKEDA